MHKDRHQSAGGRSLTSRLLSGAAIAAALLGGLAGASAGAQAQSTPPIPKSDLVLVASVINTTNPYMISNIQGAQALSKKLGIPLEIVNSNGSSQT